MTNVVMAYVGMVNGVRAYSAMGTEDERHIGEQDLLVLDLKKGKGKRSGAQNSTMHEYFTLLSKALNSAGLDLKAVLERRGQPVDIPWTPTSVKERLWAPLQKVMLDTTSTTSMKKDEVGSVYEALNRITSDMGVGVNFPDRVTKQYEEDLKCGR